MCCGYVSLSLSSRRLPRLRITAMPKGDLPASTKVAIREFVATRRGEAGIVYCLSRKKVDETAAWLAERGVRALPYHAGMDAVARCAVLGGAQHAVA